MNELIKWLQDNQLEKYADVLKENDLPDWIKIID